MYNSHRGMGPPAPAPGSRLQELLEQVRAEFDAQAGRSNEHEHQRKSLCPPPAEAVSVYEMNQLWANALRRPLTCDTALGMSLPNIRLTALWT